MALSHSPRIVTNGLVLALDAANQKSYNTVTSTSTWYDLSGNNKSGTLNGNITYYSTNSGFLSFGLVSTTTDYISFSTIPTVTSFIISNSDSSNVSYAVGSVGAVKIYNRALSADEISQNFNAYRGRYGL